MNKLNFILVFFISIMSYSGNCQSKTEKEEVQEYTLKHQTKSSTFLSSEDLPLIAGDKQKHTRNSIYKGTGKLGCKFIFQDESGKIIESLQVQENRFLLNYFIIIQHD